jgi:hypothetical protein
LLCFDRNDEWHRAGAGSASFPDPPTEAVMTGVFPLTIRDFRSMEAAAARPF